MSRTLLFMAFCFPPILASAADPGAIGRLFHSPEERRVLDQLRRGDGRNSEVPDRAVPAQQITLDGIVKRNNGKSTTWINGVAHNDHQSAQGVVVLGALGQAGTAAIQIASGKNIHLKTGQTYDINSDQVQEGFGMPATKTRAAPLAKNKAEQATVAARPGRLDGKPREPGT